MNKKAKNKSVPCFDMQFITSSISTTLVLLLLGLVVIFDLYITKFFYRYVWSHNVKMCQRSKTYRTVYEWVNAIIFATVVATLVHLSLIHI